jgi:hypothetical protein
MTFSRSVSIVPRSNCTLTTLYSAPTTTPHFSPLLNYHQIMEPLLLCIPSVFTGITRVPTREKLTNGCVKGCNEFFRTTWSSQNTLHGGPPFLSSVKNQVIPICQRAKISVSPKTWYQSPHNRSAGVK